MRKNKRRNKILILAILVLTISIGFAVLSTTLKINGISIIGKNSWNIYWDNIEVTNGSVTPTTAAYIKDAKKTEIEYAVRFDLPGEFYEFTVDAVNAGTLDGIITEIDSKVNGVKIENANLPSYIKYSVKYADGNDVNLNDLLKKKTNNEETRKKYRVRIEFDKELVNPSDINDMDDDVTYTFNYSVKYSQKVKTYTEEEPNDFETDPWRVITQTARSGNACDYYNVGDTREIDLGTYGVHTVRIANCSTDTNKCNSDEYSHTACGLVLEFTDSITNHKMNNTCSYDFAPGICNVGGWESSEMRRFLNNEVYNAMPKSLRNAISKTYVISGHGYVDSDNFVTEDKLYLLTLNEVYGDLANYPDITPGSTDVNQTWQLDYYKDVIGANYNKCCNNHNCPEIAKKINGSKEIWWTRTATSGTHGYFDAIYTDGSSGYPSAQWDVPGASPAFRIG